MRSALRSAALVPVVALTFLAGACGGGKAPQTPQEAAEMALKAIAEGKADPVKAALPTKADFEAVVKAEGKEAKPEEIDKELAEIDAKVPKRLADLQGEAKAAGLDLAAAKLSNVTSKEDVDDGLTELQIEATVSSGSAEATLALRAVKLERGLVMFRPPQLEVGGLCKKAIANVAKVSAGVDNEMAKSINQTFTGDAANLEAECEKGIKERPEQKGQVECMASAADWPTLEGCMKR